MPVQAPLTAGRGSAPGPVAPTEPGACSVCRQRAGGAVGGRAAGWAAVGIEPNPVAAEIGRRAGFEV